MIKNILHEQFKDLISEDTLSSIEEAFQKAVDEKTEQRLQLESENLRSQIDEDHTAKLKQLVERIDEDHTAKVKKLVEAIDMDHSAKLQKLIKAIDTKHTAMLEQIVEKYESELTEKAQGFQERLVEEVSNYLDLYIDRTIPTQQITEAVSNIKAAKQLQQIRQIVGIDEEFIDTEVKEALVDGKKIIDSLRSELNRVVKENVELNHKASKAEASIVLEKLTSQMPSAKKNFVVKLLGDKAPTYIEENISYVVEMFEKQTQQEFDEVKESVKQQFTKAPRVDRQIIEEKRQTNNNEINQSGSSDSVAGYLNEMKNLSKFRFAE